MKKIFVAAAVAAMSMAVVTGSANAAGPKSPTEFQNMIEKIHARQAEQRANIMEKVSVNSTMTHDDFHAKQAGQHAKTKSMIGGMSHAEFHTMLKNVSIMQSKQRAEIMNTLRSRN